MNFLRETKVKSMKAAEDAALTALKEFRCKLGGGTEWFTGSKDKIVKIFDDSVKDK